MSLQVNVTREDAERTAFTTKNSNNNESILDYMVLELQQGLINDLNWLFKESNNYNLLINVGDSPNVKSFKAHSSILSARSLYFRALLSSGHHLPSNKKGSLIEITQTNIDSEVFEVMLKFIYTGEIILEDEKDVERLFDYIIAAEKLWLYQLIQYIENYLIYQMDDWLKSNFIYVFTKLVSNSSSFKLLHEFVNDILKNHSNLLFNSVDFYNLTELSLINLLQNRKFSKDKSEDQIWELVLNWGRYQNIDLIRKDITKWVPLDFIKLQNTLHRCIPLIRFTEFSPDVFYDLVEPYRLALTNKIYDQVTKSPKFVAYKQLSRSRSTSNSTLSPQRKSSISNSNLQPNSQNSLQSIPNTSTSMISSQSNDLSMFPEKPLPLPPVINQSFSHLIEPIINSSSSALLEHQSSLRSVTSTSSINSITTSPKSSNLNNLNDMQRSSKSKYLVKKRKQTLSYKGQSVLLVKQTNSVPPAIHTMVKRRSKPTYVYSIETSNVKLSTTEPKPSSGSESRLESGSKSKLLESKLESKFESESESESEFTRLEHLTQSKNLNLIEPIEPLRVSKEDVTRSKILNVIEPIESPRVSKVPDMDSLTRKSKGRVNRKTSIITNSRPSTPISNATSLSIF